MEQKNISSEIELTSPNNPNPSASRRNVPQLSKNVSSSSEEGDLYDTAPKPSSIKDKMNLKHLASVPPYFPILILSILLFIISVSIYRNSKKIETVADVTEERISKLEEDPPTPAKIVIVESETASDNSTKMIFLAMFLGGILYFLYKKQ